MSGESPEFVAKEQLQQQHQEEPQLNDDNLHGMSPPENDTTTNRPPPQSSLPPAATHRGDTGENDGVLYPEVFMNRALYDPPRWGWTALGGIADVLSPHERSRRYSTCMAYRKKAQKLKRIRKAAGPNITHSNNSSCSSNGNVNNSKSAAVSTSQLKDPPPFPPSEPAQESSSTSFSSIAVNKFTSTTTPVAPKTSQSSTSAKAALVEAIGEPSHEECKKEHNSIQSKTQSIATIVITTAVAATSSETTKIEEETANNTVAKREEPHAYAAGTKNENKKQQSLASSDHKKDLPRQQPRIDVGIQTVGVPTNILGIEIQRQQQNPLQQQGVSSEGNNEDATNEAAVTVNNTRQRRRCGRPPKASRRSGAGNVHKNKISKYKCQVQSLGTISTRTDDDNVEGVHSGDNEISGTGIVLDMFAYHQGREGMEARDADTGELLFTQPVTDTNHDLDAPKSVLTIRIEFPLEDEEDSDDECSSNNKNNSNSNNVATSHDNKETDGREDTMKSRKKFATEGKAGSLSSAQIKTSNIESEVTATIKKKKTIYQEDVTWDLSDANTPTPLAFAISIGNNFGLSFGQTMDLASTIDRQIEKHVAENTQFREPIAVKANKESTLKIRKLGPIIQPYRYDQIVRSGKQGGTFKPKKDNKLHAKSRSSLATGVWHRQNRNSGSLATGETALSSVKAGRRRDSGHTSSKNRRSHPPALKESGKENSILNEELNQEVLDEVKRRANLEAESAVRSNCTSGNIGLLATLSNVNCHICKSRKNCGFQFQCLIKNHVYCLSHLQKRLGVTSESGCFVYNSCPICSLTCECARCVRKLNTVATVFKARCIETGKKISQVDFPNLLSHSRNAIPQKELDNAIDIILNSRREDIRTQKGVTRSGQEHEAEETSVQRSSHGKQTRTIQLVDQVMVPRPPLSDFPAEVQTNGFEIDESANAYFIVYSAKGRRPVTTIPDAWLDEENGATLGPRQVQPLKNKNTAEVQEDGNVDYCHICKNAGHLILCDFCPRAFHANCLESHNKSSPDKDHWECFVCKQEKTESDDDFVDGRLSMDLINGAFLNLDVTNERSLVGLEVLSVIHQMLQSLINYDFGNIFGQPVSSEVLGYKEIVKRPMDIGTICSKLVNGDYARLLGESFSMDDLVTRVLNDIELIWRNCIMFNVIGSSVARMAVVLRRRVRMICKRSIFGKLTEEVKNNVENYRKKFDSDWARASSEKWMDNAIKYHKPRSKLKVKTTASGKHKKVAVLDSVTGRVVNMYTSIKTASKAVEIMLKCGHRCEWNADAQKPSLNLKSIMQRSKDNPNMLLFGYRWLFLDDLDEGRITFTNPVCDIIEMQLNQSTSVFQSVEEALSSSQLPTISDIYELRKKLTILDRSSVWTEISGVRWRRPVLQNADEDKSIKSAEPQLILGPVSGTFIEELQFSRNCTVLKQDLITDKNLVGFDSIQLAHQDWVQTAICSPSFPQSEDITIENFKSHYLNGDRNIDGIIWQSVDDRSRTKNAEQKEVANLENTCDGMENQGRGDNQNTVPSSTNEQDNNLPPRIQESVKDSYAAIATTVDDDQQVPLEDTRICRKRKCMEDDKSVDFPPGKETRFAVVTVE